MTQPNATRAVSFSDLGLIEPITRALSAENYSHPTPIQAQAIPHLLDGRDLLGCAQTGTGKTAAFALPILQRLAGEHRAPAKRSARALILAPTRELAIQIGDSFRTYGRNLRLSRTVIFGGVGQNPQVQAMARGVDVLIATPGRLLDLMNQGHVRLDDVGTLVLDEADRMLDMGFIHDVRRILKALPPKRQNLLFSATMPDDIVRLADSILQQPVRVEVTPVASTAERIEQRIAHVELAGKRALLARLLKQPAVTRALVFARTKHGADKVVRQLDQDGVAAAAIHGNKSQNARQRALEDFRAGKIRALVATDIAARGIDVDGVSHVLNYDLPNIPETYVHRIGRTGRAGAEGIAISFCSGGDDRTYLRDIERLIRNRIPELEGFAAPARGAAPEPRPQRDERPRSHGRGTRPQPKSNGHRHAPAQTHGARPAFGPAALAAAVTQREQGSPRHTPLRPQRSRGPQAPHAPNPQAANPQPGPAPANEHARAGVNENRPRNRFRRRHRAA